MDGYFQNFKQRIKIMLKRIQISFLFVILALNINCNRNTTNVDFTKDNIRDYTKENFYKYKDIYSMAIDSINSHKQKRFNDWTLGTYRRYWELDSCLVFNNDSTRCMGLIYTQTKRKNAQADQYSMVNGFKIDGQWRFGSGRDSWVAPHDFYGDSLYAPLPMNKMKYLGHQSLMSYFIERTDGSLTPNCKMLDDYFYDRRNFGLPKDFPKEKFDSINMYYFNTLIYNSYVTDAELHELDSLMDNSVQPPEPLKDSKGRYIHDRSVK
jgi:hypothetical protein